MDEEERGRLHLKAAAFLRSPIPTWPCCDACNRTGCMDSLLQTPAPSHQSRSARRGRHRCGHFHRSGRHPLSLPSSHHRKPHKAVARSATGCSLLVQGHRLQGAARGNDRPRRAKVFALSASFVAQSWRTTRVDRSLARLAPFVVLPPLVLYFLFPVKKALYQPD